MHIINKKLVFLAIHNKSKLYITIKCNYLNFNYIDLEGNRRQLNLFFELLYIP